MRVPKYSCKTALGLRLFANVMRGLALCLWLGGAILNPLTAKAVGTWTQLDNIPGADTAIFNMLLMSDGTVLAHDVNTGTDWYKLTPTSSGSYIQGTWSQVASMNYGRYYCASQVLTNGNVFMAGGEYDNGSNNAEAYNPLEDTWTMAPTTPGVNEFYDAASEILPNGNVLVAPVTPAKFGETLVWNSATNTWTVGPTLYRGDDQDEASWVKLADQSILTIDPFGTNSERYIPSLNKWVADANVPVTMYSSALGELGAGFLLPNGKAFYLGGTAHTAIYTPSTITIAGIYTPAGTTNDGKWTAGPNIPSNRGVQDGPAAMMSNGKILLCAGSTSTYNPPCYFYEYSYITNSFVACPSPTSATIGASFDNPPFVCCMLDLPDGSVLLSEQGSQLYVYQPDASPALAAGQPVINSVTPNSDGSFLVTGTMFNGISEGAAYGDDAQMNSNYPIVRLTDAFGNVYYARTYNWSNCGVMTGTNVVNTHMTLPANLPYGTYSLVVIANGNRSAPVAFTYPPAPTINSGTAFVSGGFNLNFNGLNGQGYHVYTSTNLSAPFANWTLIASGSFAGRPINCLDTTATNSQQFYQITSP